MCKKKILSIFVASWVILAGNVFAAEPDNQCYSSEKLQTWDRENVAGGTGTLFGQFSFTRNQATNEQAIKEIGWMTLQPGSSIGLHKHGVNEDTYIIVSGEGVFTDNEGKETIVKAGDITIARAGQGHALRNEGTEPLRFLDVIAQNDGAKK